MMRHDHLFAHSRRLVGQVSDLREAQASLDFVELVMELEDTFRQEMNIPANRIQEIRSIGELIDYIIRELPD
jgi:acyl carrier protein